MYSLSSKILHRVELILNRANNLCKNHVSYKMSRDIAHKIRKQIIVQNGREVINNRLLNEIKKYCSERFGSTSYWPWLALYTELTGKFKRGWIPDDFYRFELLPEMNPEKFMRFSEAKTIDHKLFNELIIAPLFFRTNGQYCYKNGTIKTKSEIKELLADFNEEIIIKPASGRGGNKIMFEHSAKLCLDDLPGDTDLIFQKVVRQHPELDKLYPYSINTFRVLTYIDSKGIIKIKFIIIRFGQGGTRVDNASRGGGWIFVQKDGKVKPIAYDKYGQPLDIRHPDTGFEYSHLKLPFLPRIVSFCKDAHSKFPYSRIIGWDVFINENGEPKLIEWNANNPFFWAIEARFGPFFESEFN